MRLGAVVVDCGNADALADFYAGFLGWEKHVQYAADCRWIVINDPAWKNTPIVFQEIPDYQPPVWPAEPAKQQQMMHLDFYVTGEELAEMSRHAEELGAKKAAAQFSDDWNVFLDPAGHPFCIIPIPDEMAKLCGMKS